MSHWVGLLAVFLSPGFTGGVEPTAEPSPPEEAQTPRDEDVFPAPPEEESPCAAVYCSYHGVCVVEDGWPTCACFKGYVTDDVSGTRCVPVGSMKSPKQRATDNSPPAGEAPIVWPDPDKALEKALGYDAADERRQYKKALFEGDFKGTFLEYLHKQLRRQRISWALVMTAGIAIALSSVAFYVSENSALVTAGIIVELFAVTLIIPGAVFTAISHKRLERLNELKKRGMYLHLHPVRFMYGISLDRRRGAGGLVMGVSF